MSVLDIQQYVLRAHATLQDMLVLHYAINVEAGKQKFEPSLIASIISRETGGNPKYGISGPLALLGDGGRGFGLMQIDLGSYPDWCADWKAGKLSAQESIKKGCEVLAEKRAYIQSHLPNLTPDQQEAAFVAAYNRGQGAVVRDVQAGLSVDAETANHDYSLDVLTRKQFFKQNGFT